jgi:hypothetical protein
MVKEAGLDDLLLNESVLAVRDSFINRSRCFKTYTFEANAARRPVQRINRSFPSGTPKVFDGDPPDRAHIVRSISFNTVFLDLAFSVFRTTIELYKCSSAGRRSVRQRQTRMSFSSLIFKLHLIPHRGMRQQKGTTQKCCYEQFASSR